MPRSPVSVASSLLAVQAQDARAFPLALRARGSGFGRSDVVGSRALVRGWLMRRTLHLVAVEDWWWLHGLVAPDVPPPDGLGVVRSVLGDAGPLSRRELGERLAARGLVLEGQALPHLLADCCALGEVVGTPDDRWVLARDWVGARPAGFSRASALAELGRRYAAAHPGAGVEDLAVWSGLGKRAARAALAGIEEVDPVGSPPGPRLLPGFDEYLLGWKDRSFAVPDALWKVAFPGGGILRAVCVDDGLVCGTWSLRGGSVSVDAPSVGRFDAEVADVERFVVG